MEIPIITHKTCKDNVWKGDRVVYDLLKVGVRLEMPGKGQTRWYNSCKMSNKESGSPPFDLSVDVSPKPCELKVCKKLFELKIYIYHKSRSHGKID